MSLYEALTAARSIFRASPSGTAYLDYVEDMVHVLEDNQVIAFIELERVCLGEGAMEARALLLKHLMECRTCEGQRYVTNGCHYAHSDYDEQTCEQCNGTGQHLTPEELSELYAEAHPILEEWHELT